RAGPWLSAANIAPPQVPGSRDRELGRGLIVDARGWVAFRRAAREIPADVIRNQVVGNDVGGIRGAVHASQETGDCGIDRAREASRRRNLQEIRGMLLAVSAQVPEDALLCFLGKCQVGGQALAGSAIFFVIGEEE